jgi:hypothetical protein
MSAAWVGSAADRYLHSTITAFTIVVGCSKVPRLTKLLRDYGPLPYGRRTKDES